MSYATVVDTAISQVGTTEYPPNSNKVKYNTEYYGQEVSGDAYPWCITFLWWCFTHGGESSAFYGGNKTASSTQLMNYYIAQEQFVTSGYKIGDIVFYNFSGGSGADHAEIIISVGNGVYVTVGGNTTPGDEGSQNNGGCVARKTRYASQFLGAGRPSYGSSGGGSAEPTALRTKIIQATSRVLAMRHLVPESVAVFQKEDISFSFSVNIDSVPFRITDPIIIKLKSGTTGYLDYGDGREKVILSDDNSIRITYSEIGQYTITIEGELIDIDFKNTSTVSIIKKIISINKRFPKSMSEKEDFSSLFMYANNMISIPSGLFDNCIGAKYFGACFGYCRSLASLPSKLFSKCLLAEDFNSCFGDNYALQNVPNDMFDGCANINNVNSCFVNCIGITSNVPELWITNPTASHNSCFANCLNAENYSVIPSDWK